MSSLNENKSGATSPKTVNTSKWDVYEYDNSDDYKQKYNELGITLYFDTDVEKNIIVQEVANFLNDSDYEYSIDMFTIGYKDTE